LPKNVVFPVPNAITTTEVDDITVIPLPKLVDLKLASAETAPHRQKDSSDVQELIKNLDLPREFVEELDVSVRKPFMILWQQVQDAKQEGKPL